MKTKLNKNNKNRDQMYIQANNKTITKSDLLSFSKINSDSFLVKM